MPTIEQLVRNGRKDKVSKSKSPSLGIGYNTLEKKYTKLPSPQKRGDGSLVYFFSRVLKPIPKLGDLLFVVLSFLPLRTNCSIVGIWFSPFIYLNTVIKSINKH